MKFNDVQNLSEDKIKDVELKQTVKKQNQKNIIDSMHRFGNVGVYIMKNGKKGLFREIASYVNSGSKSASWALKISNTDGWHIQFGINPSVDFTSNDIYLSELLSIFEDKYDNIEISGHRKVVIISYIENKQQVEEIANYLINMFRDIELNLVDDVINDEFTFDETKGTLKIIGFYPENKQDAESYKKFNNIIKRLANIQLSTRDNKNYNIVKNKINNKAILKDNDKQILNNLMKDYFTTHERISIAMKYLKKE